MTTAHAQCDKLHYITLMANLKLGINKGINFKNRSNVIITLYCLLGDIFLLLLIFSKCVQVFFIKRKQPLQKNHSVQVFTQKVVFTRNEY